MACRPDAPHHGFGPCEGIEIFIQRTLEPIQGSDVSVQKMELSLPEERGEATEQECVRD